MGSELVKGLERHWNANSNTIQRCALGATGFSKHLESRRDSEMSRFQAQIWVSNDELKRARLTRGEHDEWYACEGLHGVSSHLHHRACTVTV